MALEATPPGMRYRDDQVYIDETVIADDGHIEPDKRTMLLVQSIGNSIHPSVQLEIDYASNHPEGKMPILDFKVWVETSNMGTRILHEFYEKDAASKAS